MADPSPPQVMPLAGTPAQPVPDRTWKSWEATKWLEDLIKYVTSRPNTQPP